MPFSQEKLLESSANSSIKQQQVQSESSAVPGARTFQLLFMAFIIYGTLIPFSFCELDGCVSENINTIAWSPFVDPDGSRASIPDIVQNILLFIPLGFLGMLAAPKSNLLTLLKISLLGAALSGFVETAQLMTTDRTTSITDLITNTGGTFVGALAAQFFSVFFTKAFSSSQRQMMKSDRPLQLLIITAGIATASSLQPFDFSLDFAGLKHNIKYLLSAQLGFPDVLKDELNVGFRFFLFGGALAYWLRDKKITHYVLKSFVLSCSVGLALEVSQIIIRSRLTTLDDALLIILSCFLGIIFVSYTKPIPIKGSVPTFWVIATIIITACGAAMQNLSPFETAYECRDFNWIPFYSYYERTTFVALSNFIESILIYFPMGFALQAISKGKNISIFSCILTLIFATSIELSQSCIAGRYPDITDIIGALTGSLVAGWLCLFCKRSK